MFAAQRCHRWVSTRRWLRSIWRPRCIRIHCFNARAHRGAGAVELSSAHQLPLCESSIASLAAFSSSERYRGRSPVSCQMARSGLGSSGISTEHMRGHDASPLCVSCLGLPRIQAHSIPATVENRRPFRWRARRRRWSVSAGTAAPCFDFWDGHGAPPGTDACGEARASSECAM